MAQTLKGKATYHSNAGTVTFQAIIADGAAEIHGATSFTRRADITPRTNINEEVVGFKIRNGRWEVTVTCYASIGNFPSGNANADALKALILPKECSKVTLASFPEATRTGDATTYGAPSMNGDYVYQEGGSLELSDDFAKITLQLTMWDHETAANLTKAVT